MTTLAYRSSPLDGLATAEWEAILGSATLHGWLENPLTPHGIRLLDNLVLTDLSRTMAAWPIGRAFTRHGELRWEHQPGGLVHLVAISAAPELAAWQEPVTLVEIDAYTIALWGERRQGVWSSGRIPHLDRIYPAHWRGPTIGVAVRVYEAADTETPLGDGSFQVTQYLHFSTEERA